MISEYRAWVSKDKVMGKIVAFTNNNGAVTIHVDYPNVGLITLVESENVIAMQSTGLKDINGIEIYESDIVRYQDGEYSFQGVVRYSVFGWFVDGSGDNYSFEDFSDEQTMTSDVEIIGNVYEAKDLLEVKE